MAVRCCRQRSADAPADNGSYDSVDGNVDQQWRKTFPWSAELKRLNQQYFGLKGFRWAEGLQRTSREQASEGRETEPQSNRQTTEGPDWQHGGL